MDYFVNKVKYGFKPEMFKKLLKRFDIYEDKAMKK